MSSSDESDNVSVENEDIKDDERTAIRAQLSTLSFEQLQKLKEEVGAKVYKEALFGTKSKKSDEKKVFKRENKNRPREMSAKKPVPLLAGIAKVKKEKEKVRDPRFDPLCGEFDKKEFSQNYNFLSDLRMNDIKQIRAELKQTTDPARVQTLRRLLQRLNDQHKASKKQRIEKEKREQQKQEVEKEFREGRQPKFKNKSEMRVEALVKQYEDLKKEGANRIQRHLKRRQQKIKKRSHRAPTGVE